MTTTAHRRLPDSYFTLVKRFPLTHLRNDADLRAAQEMIDWLLTERLDKGARAYLAVLTDLVEAYEDANEPMADASEAEVLSELMRANGLTQGQLAKKVGIVQSTLSAVVAGRRSLTKEQVIKLARFFRVSPGAFLPM